MNGLHRQGTDFPSQMYGMPNVPPHLRSEMGQASGRSSPSLTSAPPNGAMPQYQQHQQQRGPVTSHPTAYGPPSVLEPPTSTDNTQPGSATGSPHMGAMGWQSPHQQGIGSPAPNQYSYADPNTYGHPQSNLYYANAGVPRPRSTEPNHYDPRNGAWGHMGNGETGAVNQLS